MSQTPANSNLRFEDLPTEVRMTFRGGMGKEMVLQAGHRLYKFTSHPIVTPRGVTPWWSSVEPFAGFPDTGLAGLQQRAARLSVGPSDLARARSAVAHHWNGLGNLVRIQLNCSYKVFVGQCANAPFYGYDPRQATPEQLAADAKIRWIGGAVQAYIPNLRPFDFSVL